MIGSLKDRTLAFYRKDYLLFWSIGAMITVTVILLIFNYLDPKQSAFVDVCSGLVSQVLQGDATRFDYMATRCPAWMLTEAEAAMQEIR